MSSYKIGCLGVLLEEPIFIMFFVVPMADEARSAVFQVALIRLSLNFQKAMSS